MDHRFSFANAMLHFAQARGPGGFIWKYALSYLIAVLLMGGLAYLLFQPLIGLFTDVLLQVARGAMTGDDVEVVITREITGMAGRIIFSYIGLLLLTALVWSMFEAAIQRRYVREEGFSIGVGADEFRLLLVAVMWVLFNIVGYLASAIIAGILGAIIMSIGGGENYALGFSFPIVFLLAAFEPRPVPAALLCLCVPGHHLLDHHYGALYGRGSRDDFHLHIEFWRLRAG